MNVELGLFFAFFGMFSIYLLTLYLISPTKGITIREIFGGVVAGILSTSLLQFLYVIFPVGDLSSKFVEYMWVVGPREELCKFAVFWLLTEWISKHRYIRPIEYMVLSIAVALGFALEENLHYYLAYGNHVVGIRNFSAMPAHMFFGGIIGYWYGLGKLNVGKFGNRINLGRFFKRTRLLTYSLIGVWLASFAHGIWNYKIHFYAQVLNLVLEDSEWCVKMKIFNSGWFPLTLFFMFVLIFFMRFLYRDLIRLENEKIKYLKNHELPKDRKQ